MSHHLATAAFKHNAREQEQPELRSRPPSRAEAAEWVCVEFVRFVDGEAAPRVMQVSPLRYMRHVHQELGAHAELQRFAQEWLMANGDSANHTPGCTRIMQLEAGGRSNACAFACACKKVGIEVTVKETPS